MSGIDSRNQCYGAILFFLTSLYMRTRSSRLVAWGIQVYELLLLLIFFTLSRSVIPTEDKFILEAKLQYY